jgi:hypothetical protein
MTDNIVEKLARIIDPAAFDEQVVSYRNDEHRDECQWIAIDKTREILAALREPSEAMIEAGASAAFNADGHGDHWLHRARAAWATMIDTAFDASLSTEGNEG